MKKTTVTCPYCNNELSLASLMGKAGGSKTSEKKTAASKENAKKGGWPKGKPRKKKEETGEEL